MKIVHKNIQAVPGNSVDEGMALEKAGEIKAAIKTYENIIVKEQLNEKAYRRLMILYRKEKAYRKELALIKKGIKAFEELYRKTVRVRPSRTIARISQQLLKSMQLLDKKGHPVYQKEPIAGWNRRKTHLEKIIRKQRDL